MLWINFIKPAYPECASPILFAPKERRNFRFCAEYSEVERRDRQRCLSNLLHGQMHRPTWRRSYISVRDANSGYWQIDINERDCDETTFPLHYGLYRFIRMPFGLKSAPSMFQGANDMILSTVKWHFSLIYLQDIVIFSKSVSDYIFTFVQSFAYCPIPACG